MKDQFVTYEIAKRLKELGFNEPCFGIYGESGELIIDDDWLYATNQDTMSETKNPTAPLWQQAVDYLRKKYKIAVCQTVNGEWFCSEILPGLGLNEIKHFPKKPTVENAILKALKLISKTH